MSFRESYKSFNPRELLRKTEPFRTTYFAIPKEWGNQYEDLAAALRATGNKIQLEKLDDLKLKGNEFAQKLKKSDKYIMLQGFGDSKALERFQASLGEISAFQQDITERAAVGIEKGALAVVITSRVLSLANEIRKGQFPSLFGRGSM